MKDLSLLACEWRYSTATKTEHSARLTYDLP